MGALTPWFTTLPKSSDCVNQVQKIFVKSQKALKTLGFQHLGLSQNRAIRPIDCVILGQKSTSYFKVWASRFRLALFMRLRTGHQTSRRFRYSRCLWHWFALRHHTSILLQWFFDLERWIIHHFYTVFPDERPPYPPGRRADRFPGRGWWGEWENQHSSIIIAHKSVFQ